MFFGMFTVLQLQVLGPSVIRALKVGGHVLYVIDRAPEIVGKDVIKIDIQDGIKFNKV